MLMSLIPMLNLEVASETNLLKKLLTDFCWMSLWISASFNNLEMQNWNEKFEEITFTLNCQHSSSSASLICWHHGQRERGSRRDRQKGKITFKKINIYLLCLDVIQWVRVSFVEICNKSILIFQNWMSLRLQNFFSN